MHIAKRYAQGRLLSSLEGGYNLTALSASVEHHVQALLAA
jgi:acetoin utilization deacetylase AcuC-like enzyme